MSGPAPATAGLSPLRLRPATAADMDAVTAIYAHHVLNGRASFELDAPDVAEITRRFEAITALGLPYLVAEGDGAVLGYAYAARYRERPAYRFTVEDSIYVAPEAGRRGVGRALLAELIERCTALGYRQMVAVIGDSANVPSIGLHVRLGFRLVGVFPAIGFKFGGWVDSVMMSRPLGEGERTLPG